MNLFVIDKKGVKHCYYGVENLNISSNFISFDYFLGYTSLSRKYFSIEGVVSV